jgi:hypothetical protein
MDWRTLPLIVLKCFAIWMKNFYSGEGLLPWGPLNFQGYIPLSYCPQISGAIGSIHFLICKTHPSCFLLSVGGKNLTCMNNASMPWGMVVTSWSKQPSSPPNWRFASYFTMRPCPKCRTRYELCHILCQVQQWGYAWNAKLGMKCKATANYASPKPLILGMPRIVPIPRWT